MSTCQSCLKHRKQIVKLKDEINRLKRSSEEAIRSNKILLETLDSIEKELDNQRKFFPALANLIFSKVW